MAKTSRMMRAAKSGGAFAGVVLEPKADNPLEFNIAYPVNEPRSLYNGMVFDLRLIARRSRQSFTCGPQWG